MCFLQQRPHHEAHGLAKACTPGPLTSRKSHGAYRGRASGGSGNWRHSGGLIFSAWKQRGPGCKQKGHQGGPQETKLWRCGFVCQALSEQPCLPVTVGTPSSRRLSWLRKRGALMSCRSGFAPCGHGEGRAC